MSKTQILQNSLISGVLSTTLRGRIDIEKYQSGVEQADNVDIIPHGGMTRRAGLASANTIYGAVGGANDLYSTKRQRLIPWEGQNGAPSIILAITTDSIKQLINGKVEGYIPFSHALLYGASITQKEVDEMDYVQIEGRMVLFPGGTKEPLIVSGVTSTTFVVLRWYTYSTSKTLYDMPIYDFSAGYAGAKERYTGDGVNADFILLYSGDIFTVYVDGVKQVRTTQFTYDPLAQKITFTAGNIPAAGKIVDVISGYIGIPEDSDSPFEDIWSNARGWPKAGAIHQGRLVVGGTTSKPMSVWMSGAQDFFNFNTGEGSSGEAIFDTLGSGIFGTITNIASGRALHVFTNNDEFANQAQVVTPSTSSWVKQSSYGNTRVSTANVDGSIFYTDKNGKSVRSMLYSFQDDGFNSTSLDLLATDIVSDVQDMALLDGTSNSISNLLYVVNGDGSVAVLNTMRSEAISGWTRLITDGNVKNVCVLSNEVYFLVERETGYYYIEKLDSTHMMDHSFRVSGVATRVPILSELPSFSPSKEYGILIDGSYYGTGTAYLDGSIYYVDLPVASAVYAEVGMLAPIAIKTMPLSAATQEGQILNERKRVIRSILNLHESLGVYLNDNQIADRQMPIVLDTAPTPYTGIKEVFLLGYSRTTQITVTQPLPLPFTLLQLDHEVEY